MREPDTDTRLESPPERTETGIQLVSVPSNTTVAQRASELRDQREVQRVPSRLGDARRHRHVAAHPNGTARPEATPRRHRESSSSSSQSIRVTSCAGKSPSTDR